MNWCAKVKKALSVIIFLIFSLLTGCMLGPNYVPTEGPQAAEYTHSSLPGETASAQTLGGEAQSFVESLDISARWWEEFQSEALDQLVREALNHNPSLAKAQAVLEQAQEDVHDKIGTTFYPTVDGSISAIRQKVNLSSLGITLFPSPPPFTLYNIGTTVSYNLDLFGGNRRELEALCALVDYQKFEFIASQLSLAANVVTAAIKRASLLQQIETTQSMIELEEDQLEIIQKRYAAGGIAVLDVLSQRTLLEQTKATLFPLQKQFEQTQHQLAIYLGQIPSEASIPIIRLDELKLPCELPVSLPSQLVRQRPDIQASEALLHQACANVGVATANLFPNVAINASFATEATKISNLFGSQASAWSVGPTLMQPIFHGGSLFARKRKAIAAYQQALAAYQETVLQGIQNVADTLKALEYDAKSLEANAATTMQAFKTFEIVTSRYEAGGVGYLSLLDAQKQYYQALLTQAQAKADRLADSAALFQALGGGWWNEGSP